MKLFNKDTFFIKNPLKLKENHNMIYTTDMGFATESGNVAPISAVDAIIDIYEAALEYNETSFLYEGVADSAKNTIRNIATRVANFINGLIVKVKNLVKEKMYKSFLENVKKAKKNPDRVNIRDTNALNFPKYVASDKIEKKTLETSLKACADENYVRTTKAQIKDLLANDAAFTKEPVTSVDGLEAAVRDLNNQIGKQIKMLESLKSKALKELKDKKGDDATSASRYASLVVWVANTTTNSLLSKLISSIRTANKRLNSKKED